jgi:uncharacterized protein (TIGR00156 family)
MQKLLYVLPIALLLGVSPASAGGDNALITSAAAVASAKDDQPVQLRGKIVSRQSRNHYVVADESGDAVVKITRRQRNGNSLIPGTEVEIQGETDTRLSGPTRVEAKSVTVLAGTGWTSQAVRPEPQPEPARP